MRVTISGPPGSGKTTVARVVAKTLGLKLILTGQVFREQAKQAKMDVHKYNNLAEKDRSIDEKLDDEIIHLAMKSDNVLVEGRLAGHLFKRRNIPAFRVCVTAPARIRAERIANREKTTAEREMEKIIKRELSEKSRYLSFYDIDIEDMSVYDLVVDSSDISANDAAEIVAAEIRKMQR
jgi:cytidylate kinase/H/ACA ribonucleoprotein complex subunit 4